MPEISLQVVQSAADLQRFVEFPWTVNRGDPCWVPPLIDGQLAKLDPARNPFWQGATRQLWLALQGNRVVGTVAAILDGKRIAATGEKVGLFGFFESINDPQVARILLNAAGDWLKAQGMTGIQGPFNPGANDEAGVLVEGFATRPALMEGHNPPYYAALLEGCGYTKYNDSFARLFRAPPGVKSADECIPPKLLQVAERAASRPDLAIRTINMAAWEAEIRLATRIYNEALAGLPGITPMTEAEFLDLANGFKPFINPATALLAEIGGRPVGFALALPDLNEALQRVNGRLGPFNLLKLWWFSHRLWFFSRGVHRATFKILVMIPQFQGRGVEAVLTVAVARALFASGYREVDMSMTGEENLKSNRLQEHLGFQVYRRYRIYQKAL